MSTAKQKAALPIAAARGEPFYLVRTDKYYQATDERSKRPRNYSGSVNPVFARKATLDEAKDAALAATTDLGEDVAVYEVRLVGRYAKPAPTWTPVSE